MAETTVVDRWIYGVLSVDATLAALVGTRIYRGVGPKTASYPIVTYFMQPGTPNDVRGVGTFNVMTHGYWIIKAVDRNNSALAVETISTRLYTLLHGKTGVVTGGAVLACVRDEPIAYEEEFDGAIYQHLGGLYRVTLQ